MAASDRLWLSDRQVDLVTGDVVRAGEAVARLTTKERELLAYLAGRPRQDVSRADLLTDVWGYAPTARTRAVDFTVRRLRQKIEADPGEPEHVCTAHGVGYRFQPGVAPEPEPAPTLPAALPLVAILPTGDPPDEASVALRAFEHGARLVSLTGGTKAQRIEIARHVAAAFDLRVLWLEGALAALGQRVHAAEQASARRLLLRRDTPELVVLEELEIGDIASLEELATTLRSLPSLRVLALGTTRLGLAAEHVLPLQAAEGIDLTALDAIWARLGEVERQAWGQLSACVGSLELDTAEALLGEGAMESLEVLDDAGLLASRRDGRIRLREAAARYGRQRLGAGLASARQRRRALLLERHRSALQDLDLDLQDISTGEAEELAALWSDQNASWADRIRAAVLLASSGEAPTEDLQRLEALPDALELGEVGLAVRLHRARLRQSLGEARASLPDARDALHLARRQGHARGEAMATTVLARALLRLGRLAEAVEVARRARALARRRQDVATEIRTLRLLGRVEHELGEADAAESSLREALRLSRLQKDVIGLAKGHTLLGTLLRHRGQLAAADQAYEDAAQVLAGRSDARAAAVTARLRLEIATLQLEREQLTSALSILEPLAGELERAGRLRTAGEAWLAVAGTRWRAGDLDGAIEGFDHARSAFEIRDDLLYTGLALAWSGAAAAGAGELAVADAWVEEARAHLEPLGLQRGREVLSACLAHLDRARGRSIDEALAWADRIEHDPGTWGDVRLALRILSAMEAS